jgi:hypothetical protein
MHLENGLLNMRYSKRRSLKLKRIVLVGDLLDTLNVLYARKISPNPKYRWTTFFPLSIQRKGLLTGILLLRDFFVKRKTSKYYANRVIK